MTDSPINLDEAKRLIEVGRLNQELFTGHEKPGIQNVLIEYPYLESIVSELEAGRKRIAELEAELARVKGNWATDSEYQNKRFDSQCEFYNELLANAIIPQAEDVEYLHLAIGHAEYCRSITGELFSSEKIDPEIAMLKRYLAAIEGDKP